jgi:hypothetical protein
MGWMNFMPIKAQSLNTKTCFREVRFFGKILWRELKSYQKIAQLTEMKKEPDRLYARFLALAFCSHKMGMFLALLMLSKKD